MIQRLTIQTEEVGLWPEIPSHVLDLILILMTLCQTK
jgi:hypothetical protein